MTDFVTITHPEAGEARVPASAVPHWAASGWTPASETSETDDLGARSVKRPTRSASQTEKDS